ncbi:Sec28 protein [Candida orthopsilosis Co 90-125]|uniref:Sec28 protein n=1 Tax=Candida orthopsilosis (strain 90-125) TaxID=1136231 RepID=H8X0S7_CANO9|nr:Sec28 protein [Candida orthopsilosis Co 90-125]CCG21966.1 Sec28 protein [Candida orthopsilosis Co 90-125]
MDAFSDSGELYTIRYQFYTNQYHKVKSYSLEEFSEENQLKVFEFQIRSTVALDQDASQLIEQGKTRFPDNEEFFQLLQAWNDLHDFGTDDSTYFEDLKQAKFELQAILASLYLVKFAKDIDQSIKFLTDYIDKLNNLQKYNEIEVFLILIQLYFIKGNFKQATFIFKVLNSFPDFSRDNIIYQIIESWYISIQNGTDNVNNSYSLYDEVLSNSYSDDDNKGKVHNLTVLLVLTLQLKHYPEAQEVLDQISTLTDEKNADLIANQITLDRLVNYGQETNGLLAELKKVNVEHELIKDEESKNEIFDAIVAKYQTV